MLLRLRVRWFKNLRDVDIRFGPLTCFLGPNGVGKSNAFDAIQFLRHLADKEVERAAEAIRQPAAGVFGSLDLFYNRDPGRHIWLSAEMLVPAHAADDFGEPVEPTSTLLRYSVELGYSEKDHRLELVSEELVHIKKANAADAIGFSHAKAFRDSAVLGRRHGAAFISTETGGAENVIQLHGDGGSRGRPVPAGPSPRTILGGTGTKQYPTIVAARREMLSWHSLHLEPTSLRTPDRFGERLPVDEHGRHIAATLNRLGKERGDPEAVYTEAVNQLSRLVRDVQAVRVREDQSAQHYVVEMQFRGSDLWLPPRALSDGTLRYLALIVMQMDTQASRVICIEEPENGIQPSGMPQLIQLLRDYAVDPKFSVDVEDNPVRQVILNSHSPEVVKQLEPWEVLFVDNAQGPEGRYARIRPVASDQNWRDEEGVVSRSYLCEWIGGAPRPTSLFD